ncbi:SRPBCC family protein [Derxia lacustris]|uniref:SRPBCC family protein n=1 Tax=Derxia lacustris TaxID=764842 RepID=UPI001C385BA5|nr:SRPBCC family protein [Derxia lacustris]
MIEARHSYTLPVSPELAFDYLSNPANDAEWQASCDACELLDGAPAVGARYRIDFAFLSRRMKFVAEITALEAPSRYAFRVIDGPFRYEGEYRLAPHADGVAVDWRFAADPGRFFGILPASLLRKVLVSQVEKDVPRLAALLTARAAQPILQD